MRITSRPVTAVTEVTETAEVEAVELPSAPITTPAEPTPGAHGARAARALALQTPPRIQSLTAEVMQSVLERVSENTGRPNLVLFDLDETLLDNRKATFLCLQAWARSADAAAHPDVVAAIAKLDSCESLFAGGAGEAFLSLGLDDAHPAAASFGAYFREHFFTNAFVAATGVSFEGAQEFLDRIEAAGGNIVFLSGRVGPSQAQGTESALHELGLMGKTPRMLITKYDRVSTPDYKREALKLLRMSANVVAMFDNDMANLTRMQSQAMGMLMVHVEPQSLYDKPLWSGK